MNIVAPSKIPDLFFNRCWFSDKQGRISSDYLSLARIQDSLAFNEKYRKPQFNDWNETPFEEIVFADPLPISKAVDYSNITEYRGDYDAYLNLIIDRLKTVLLMLDPNEKYLFSHSSGADSRILSGTMALLRDEGRASFDNVLFHCWGRPEVNSFRAILRKNKWDNISIHDDTRPDAYDVGVSSYCVDGWNPYPSQMKFWGDIDPSEYILLSGGEAGAFQLSYQEWVHSRAFFVERGEAVHRMAKIFKGVFFPFISNPLLEVLLAMPKQWRNINDARLGRDKIRTDLVNKLGLLEFPLETAYYNFNFTESRKRHMAELYAKCKFKRDHGLDVDFDDLYKRHNGWNSRAWAFAVTVYENLV